MAERWKLWALSAAIALLLGLDGWALAVLQPSGGASRRPETAATAQTSGHVPDGSSMPPMSKAPAGTASEAMPERGSPAGSEDARPQSAALPRAGTYTWRGTSESVATYSSTTKAEESESEDSARYEVLPGSDADRRVRRHSDYRESKDGDFTMGGSSYSELAWRSEGVFKIGGRVHSKGTDSSGYSEERTNGCDWAPPVPAVVYPLKEGTQWDWSSTCVDEHDERTTLSQEWKGTAQIEGWENVEIGGEMVQAVRIRYSDDRVNRAFVEGQPPGGPQPQGVRFQSEGLRWFAPSVGLDVRTESKTVVSRPEGDNSDDFEQRSESTSELVSITPK